MKRYEILQDQRIDRLRDKMNQLAYDGYELENFLYNGLLYIAVMSLKS